MVGVTRMLEAIARGEAHTGAELLPLVYDQLRRLAAHDLSQKRPGQTLQATPLAHKPERPNHQKEPIFRGATEANPKKWRLCN